MAFIKIGDAQPIIDTHDGDSKHTDKETKKVLKEVKKATKTIDEEDDIRKQN